MFNGKKYVALMGNGSGVTRLTNKTQANGKYELNIEIYVTTSIKYPLFSHF